MLTKRYNDNCSMCYDYERGQQNISTPSQRTWYLKTLKSVPMYIYDDPKNFELRTLDLRWRNTCNQACIYCGPRVSSLWAQELNLPPVIDQSARERTKEWIFNRLDKVEDVYLAGGEPLLINDNIELLERLYDRKDSITIRVNTNLSLLDTKVYQLLEKFENVHWIISVDDIEKRYEYVRYPGNWDIFSKNLTELQSRDAKISFNLVWFVLNHTSIFGCLRHLLDRGFHENALVVRPLEAPLPLNINKLPKYIKLTVREQIKDWINNSDPQHLLNKSLISMSEHLDDVDADLGSTIDFLRVLDQRRSLDSSKIFPEIYQYHQSFTTNTV